MNVPKIKEKYNMATEGIRGLVGKKMYKDVKFMGDNLKINKLSVSEVLFIQEKAKNISENDSEGFEILKTVIRSAVEGATELSDDDFNNFPLDELSKLSNEIMKFSGIGEQAGK
jgi:hypothetical protein